MPPLKNPRQERFCLEYVATGNGTRSAITAGYSPKAARSVASRMLTFANISGRLRELQAETTTPRVLEIIERKELLSEIALKGNIEKANPIAAIAELNKMEGAYPPERHAILGNLQVDFIIGKGYQELPPGGNAQEQISSKVCPIKMLP